VAGVNEGAGLGSKVKIIECPRDAWQGLPGLIAPDVKAAYLQKLAQAGFRHIDAVSFVSPSAIPQMADSEEVLRLFKAPDDVEIIGIVANVKGAERAVRTGAVQTLGFPYSVSERFLERNQRQSQTEALRVLRSIRELASESSMGVMVYISMAFGNPYGDPWHTGLLSEACDRLAEAGVTTISLADTVGVAPGEVIAAGLREVIDAHSDLEVGVHLHARWEGSAQRISAAYEAGCRRFDAAMGGLGGCPFAQDELVGNIPTEILLRTLEGLGAELPALHSLESAARMNAKIASNARRVNS